MSDSIQYGSFRNPLYRDYEKFPYGTLENTLNSPPKSGGGVQNRNQTVAGQGKSGKGKSSSSSKDSCPFCKEQKKRPLGAYMRKRGQRITTESISEDAEEGTATEQLQEEDEGTESQDDASPSGSPSAAELAGDQHHHHQQHRHGTSRQESQDSGCEAK